VAARDRLQADPQRAVVSLYARGRDYHKVLRQRLQQLAEHLAAEVGPLGHRVFTDSAPVLEVELATRAGLGWRGKHTLALAREAGSMFFLGEIFVDLALAAGCAHQRALRQLHGLHRRSAPRRPSWRRTGWTRGAASAT
jgi:epoxyqueuosine reductase QueG